MREGGGNKPHAADGVLDLDFAEGLLAVFGFEFLEHFALLGDDGLQGFLQVFFGARGGITAGGVGGAQRGSELGESSVECCVCVKPKRRGPTVMFLRTRVDLAPSDIVE